MKRMRTLLGTAFLLCLLMVLAAVPVFGAEIVESGPCGDNLTYTLDADGLLTISGTGPMWDFKRTSISGLYHETYHSTAPWGQSDYKSVCVDPGVTTIGDYAFYCWRAVSEDINYRPALISVSLPEGLTSIGHFAFDSCILLTNITFRDGLTSIGSYAFYNCDQLTNVTFPEGLTSIGSYAFYYCNRLTSLTLPEGLTNIGDYAFCSCTSLTNVTFPEGLMSIGSYAFYNCNRLTSLTLPEGLTSIGDSAFRNCSNLTSVTFPEGLTSIGDSAFCSCTSLTSVTFQEGSTSIDSNAFNGCSELREFHIDDINIWLSLPSDPNLLDVNRLKKKIYLQGELLTDLVIPEGTTSIRQYAFYNYSSLTSVTFPEGLTSIGDSAFYSCTGLTSVTFPEELTSIGDSAFYSCTGLTSVTFQKGSTSIGYSAFSNCTTLTEFRIHDIATWLSLQTNTNILGVNDLAKRIYVQDELLTDLVVPEGITSIRPNAFYNYSKLTSVTFPEGLTTIGSNAFSGCTDLKNVTLPQGLTSIANNSFRNCSGLTDLIFLGDAPSINSTAFPSLTLTVYHPEDASWTDDVKLNYGGFLTYKPLGTPSALQMTLSDTYPYYFTDDALSKEKMTTTLTYSSGAVSLLHPTQYELAADDMTTPGAKTVTISSDGLSTSYAIFVHNGHRVENIPQYWPESSHDHGNNADDIQTLHIPGANLIQITFDQRTSLEPWYDFLYVYDANDTQIARFTGTKAAGLTLTVPGDTVKLRLTSDATTADWGYALTDVSASWMEHIFTSDSGDCTICGNACAHTYADPTVTAAPWCEVTGERTYTCTQCGHSKTEAIPALGHSYENGICSNCGAIDFEAATDPGLKLGYPTLSFEDEIVYNIYFYVTDPSDVAELGLMTLTTADRYATIEDATAMTPGYVTNGTMYLVKTNGIPAAHMGDTLYFKVYAKLTDGSYAYSPLGGYNAKTYADTVLEGDYTDTMKSLVVSMLNYGAEAQRYFGHNTDALVDRSLTDAQKALVRPFDSTMVDPIVKPDPSKTGDFIRNASDFRTLYPSVSFDGAFAINLYCGPTVTVDDGMTLYWWDAETADTAERLTLNNATGSAPMELVLTDWWGQLPGIAAKDISKTYYLTCVFTSEGRTVSTGILPYSLGKYCASKADADGDPQQSFAQATAVYGYYAKNYFASIA